MRSILLRAGMLAWQRHWRLVERLADRPGAAQQGVLTRLLEANRRARFGVEHGFADIRQPSQFQARVPVQTYETLRPYIDEQRRTGARALTTESPLFYAQTSGTTGQPKYIPITPSMLAMQRAEQTLFSYLQVRVCPQGFAGKALGIMGAAVEGHLDTGHAVGSVSGHLYRSLPRMVRSRFVVPPEALGVADYDLKYLIILCLALGEPHITYLGSPNPTTFLRPSIRPDRRSHHLHRHRALADEYGVSTRSSNSLRGLKQQLSAVRHQSEHWSPDRHGNDISRRNTGGAPRCGCAVAPRASDTLGYRNFKRPFS